MSRALADTTFHLLYCGRLNEKSMLSVLKITKKVFFFWCNTILKALPIEVKYWLKYSVICCMIFIVAFPINKEDGLFFANFFRICNFIDPLLQGSWFFFVLVEIILIVRLPNDFSRINCFIAVFFKSTVFAFTFLGCFSFSKLLV